MASRPKSFLCEAILKDYFGFYVSKVGTCLLRGPLTFNAIHRQLREHCRSLDIKKSLAVLEMHELVKFKLTNRGIQYQLLPDNILRFERIFRSIRAIKQRYGAYGEAIAEEVFSKGRITFSKCVDSLVQSLKLDYESFKETFSQLVNGQILRKCDFVETTDLGVPSFTRNPKPFDFTPPAGDKIIISESGARKRLREENGSEEEDLWKFNWLRVDRILRDELILESIKRNEEYDKGDENLWNCFLQIADQDSTIETIQSSPIAVQDICKWLSQETERKHNWEDVDRKMAAVAKSDFNSPVRRIGDSGGGMYVVEYNNAFEDLCFSHVESVILEKIDERAVRIFRIVKRNLNIEEDQLEKAAMLSSKEVKEICYALLEQGFIYNKPIAKTNDFAPARTFYFYSHKMPELVYTMSNNCMDSIRNVILRRLYETIKNDVLLTTEEKMDTIIANIKEDTNLTEDEKEAQTGEVQDMYLTDEDKKNLERHKNSQRRLHSTEISLEGALFAFNMCSRFEKLKSINEAAQLASKKRRRPNVALI